MSYFFEQIEFTELSKDRLFMFVDIFDSNEMNVPSLNKLSKFLRSQIERKSKTPTPRTIISPDSATP